jgi:hypothetical protein
LIRPLQPQSYMEPRVYSAPARPFNRRDELLRLVRSAPAKKRGEKMAPDQAERQLKAIEQATGQDATTFLSRFHQAVRKDLCEQGGVLHTQWEKYRDLTGKDMLKTFGGILVGFGLAGNALQVTAVAIAVYVLYLGVQAFCAGGE